jgi:hypothetical protein
MTSGFRFGFTPRPFVGTSGSNGAHCRSLIQNSFINHVQFGRFEYEKLHSEQNQPKDRSPVAQR